MRRYHRGPDVIVTEEEFQVRAWVMRRYPVTEINQAYIVRGSVSDELVRVSHSAAGAMAIAAATWPLLESPAVTAVSTFVLAVPSMIILSRAWRRGHWHQLRAVVGQQDVALYASSNEIEFKRVARALARAMEAANTRPR